MARNAILARAPPQTPLGVCTMLPRPPKAKASDSYIARLIGTKLYQPHFTVIGSGSWSARTIDAAALMWPSIERANEQLDPRPQLVNTPPPQSTTSGLHPVSIHQMVPPKWTSGCSLLLNLSTLRWPRWLTCSGRFTHITRHSSDAGRAQDGKSADKRPTFYQCAMLPTTAAFGGPLHGEEETIVNYQNVSSCWIYSVSQKKHPRHF